MTSVLAFLFVGIILSYFGFQKLFCNGLNQLTHLNITEFGYYVFFAISGLIYSLLTGYRSKE